tara:strand:+ start:228 stop:548 length:321 start_codon:yes stop_codon:yes gene_type:complete
MNTTETDLIFERYTQTKILSEDMNGQYAPEDAPEDDQFGGMEPEEDESVGDFDEFIGKAEKFVDEIGDDGLEFLANLHKDQFEVLMDVVSDQRGYRNQMPAEDYES